VVGSNASELEDHHATLKMWAKSEGIPLPPIGHNEVIGPSQSLSPAANIAFLSTLERLEAEHSCRACWTDDVTQQSPCNDNTLDSLLTDDCLANHSLGPNKGYKPPWCVRAYGSASDRSFRMLLKPHRIGALCRDSKPTLNPRSNWWAFEMFAELTGQEMLPALAVGDACVGIVRTLCNSVSCMLPMHSCSWTVQCGPNFNRCVGGTL
jgi:hypothetical protein